MWKIAAIVNFLVLIEHSDSYSSIHSQQQLRQQQQQQQQRPRQYQGESMYHYPLTGTNSRKRVILFLNRTNKNNNYSNNRSFRTIRNTFPVSNCFIERISTTSTSHLYSHSPGSSTSINHPFWYQQRKRNQQRQQQRLSFIGISSTNLFSSPVCTADSNNNSNNNFSTMEEDSIKVKQQTELESANVSTEAENTEQRNEKKRSLDDTDAAAASNEEAKGTNDHDDNENKKNDNGNDNDNNKNKKSNRSKKKKSKKRKEDFVQNHTWREHVNTTKAESDKDQRPPHEGSYANPELQQKLGITNIDEDRIIYDETTTKLTKRKVALFLAFLGTKYGGFQVNAHQRTLQGEIEYALYKAGMLSSSNFGYPFKYAWSTSARTDKGVHACAQVCSVKIELLESELDADDDMESVREKLQSKLPDDIRVLDIQRTTRNFCAKTQRDRVRYQYMIPSFLLHPNYKGLIEEQGISLDGGDRERSRQPLSKEEVTKLQNMLKDFRSTDEQRDTLSKALKKYEGTHPFHNFTKGIKPGQATATRFIETFTMQDPIVVNGIEWIPTQVLGQSFLLHQIRKMVSMAVDVTRGTATLELMDKALSTDNEVVRVSLAPAQGLFLEMSYYRGYNRRKQQNQNLNDLDWTIDGPANDRWKEFRSIIRKHIIEEEERDGNFIQYMYLQECVFEHGKFYNHDDINDDNENDDNDNEKKDEIKKVEEKASS